MDWRQVPSLLSLRAFEAAARSGSLSGAARELNVTHPAIAQHVRALETHFGCKLMERQGAGMTPTPEGRQLATALSDGFGRIATACRDLVERDAARPLRLALTPSFAASWLMPRIGDFWAKHPGIELEMVPSPDLVDLAAQGFDMAVRYGRGPWDGVKAERLSTAGHAVVAAPGRVSGAVTLLAELADLADLPWMTEAANTEEKFWAASNGLPVDSMKIREFANVSMVLEAVRAGHGVGLLPRLIADADVRAGTLEILFEERETDLAYHILTRPERETPAVRAFRRWLKSQV
ncbi:LysR family transcriptional regulator, glycine cleavage system transcriptional activator [Palleronia marisminoris]|uniref:HTH-type transcriptional activator AmpR n=1 Tax=Palleronia marisminoris TaxID=315423 RepID=A0A1Y5T131_9RHOB|nr:LysR family transcriptional regulator [Palleronia marisminoris]SFH07057.1 LysR family transcriptional regulator, glycine cleavage system transcriptional activator [Palleronia marisminoris]SLN51661.1 HTH-type transcriptional activator AmpR [Palleronia marisminoris]